MNEHGDYLLRLDLPQFNGHLHIEEFIDGIAKVECFFNYMDVLKVRKVKLVVLRFKGVVSAWWDQTITNHNKFHKPLVRTSWEV